jgi:hypothetical protein
MTGARVVAKARGWIGTPYVHQASCRGRGRIAWACCAGSGARHAGAEPEAVPPYTPDWAEPGGREALWSAAASVGCCPARRGQRRSRGMCCCSVCERGASQSILAFWQRSGHRRVSFMPIPGMGWWKARFRPPGRAGSWRGFGFLTGVCDGDDSFCRPSGAAIGGGIGGTVLGLSGAVIGRAVGATVGRVIDQRLLGSGSAAVDTGQDRPHSRDGGQRGGGAGAGLRQDARVGGR